jgi:hypothetical protein
MNATVAALLGSLIGAVTGLAGSFFSGYVSLKLATYPLRTQGEVKIRIRELSILAHSENVPEPLSPSSL